MTVFYWDRPRKFTCKRDGTIENKAAESSDSCWLFVLSKRGSWMREQSERIQSLNYPSQVYLQAGWNNRKQKLYLGIIVDGHKCNLDCCWLFVLSFIFCYNKLYAYIYKLKILTNTNRYV